MNGKTERLTMSELAGLAGVSKITVSRALRDSDLVRPELRERIKGLAREHGYRLNVAARNLRLMRTNTVAVVIESLHGGHSLSEPTLLLLLGGLLEELTAAGYDVLLTTREHIAKVDTVSADGLIVFGQGSGASMTARAAGFGLPLVVWGSESAADGVPVIGSDNRRGGRLVAEHLVGSGRKRLFFLGDPAHPEVHDRFEGMRDVLTTSEAVLAGQQPCDFDREAGAAAVRDALAAGLRFDGVFAASDAIAAGACDALIEAGVSVPGDVSLVGYDDTQIAANHRPPLSSVRQNWLLGGQLLARSLLGLLAGEAAESRSMDVELVARASSGA